jgi:Lrp/AsnC family transcriptional regulator, leucine-responsive regulatory protein
MAEIRENVSIGKNIKLDRLDKRILNILQKDNLITNQELAEKVGLSPPPCLRRVRKLRDMKIIMNDVSIIDPFKVNKNLVFVSITLEQQREDLLANFERKMHEHAEILQCYFISGEVDYMLVVCVRDMNHFHEFARRVFANEPNIRTYRSSICLSQIKYQTTIELDEQAEV